jgi:hypothetical protein
MRVVGEIHQAGEVFDIDDESLGLAKCDLQPWNTHRRAPLSGHALPMTGTIIPYAGGSAGFSNGVSARFIGVPLTCRLADRRIIHFQWFDSDGHVYRATVSPEPE